MPLHAERPIVRVEHDSMRTIEIRDPENLFGLWSVLKTCSPVLGPDGRRYENLAWRLWGRETQCCLPEYTTHSNWSFEPSQSADPPALSSSVTSDDSETPATRSNCSSRPDLRRHDSLSSQARGKHITAIDLEKVVNSIQEKRAIEPLSPLPAQLAPPPKESTVQDTTPHPASPSPSSSSPAKAATLARPIQQESSSTVATTLCSDDASPAIGSDVSTSTDMSTHSVVHGFDPSRISTSVRSSTNLAPTPILKNGLSPRPSPFKPEPPKKKAPMFTLGGGSSDEDNCSSLDTYSLMNRSSLSENIRKAGGMKKTTSFKNEVATRTIHDMLAAEESAIETDSEDESDDNAIEEDDSDGDWEDDNEDSVPASMDERPMFPRVDSKPNLVSRRSLLTTQLHQGDRAQALQNMASLSTPAIRRSRTSTPNGPSTGNSPQEDCGLMMRPQASRAKPIIMTTSNVHPPMLSPRTTRRNMLQTELTQSLRQNLLWERQQKNSAINAVNKRVQSAASIPALRRAMTTNDIKGMDAVPQKTVTHNAFKSTTFKDSKNNNSYNDYFDQGLQEYHQKGW